MVAVPESVCRKFSAARSAETSARLRPWTTVTVRSPVATTSAAGSASGAHELGGALGPHRGALTLGRAVTGVEVLWFIIGVLAVFAVGYPPSGPGFRLSPDELVNLPARS